MLEALFAFIPLLAGYVFIFTFRDIRFSVVRESSQNVYFRAAFWGVWLFILSSTFFIYFLDLPVRISGFIHESFIVSLPYLPQGLEEGSSKWLIILFLTLFLGIFGALLLNVVRSSMILFMSPYTLFLSGHIAKVETKKAAFSGWASWAVWLYFFYKFLSENLRNEIQKYAIQKLNDDFEIIIQRALEYSLPIYVTLKNRKVYVGYVTGAINPGDKRDMIRMIPYMSGYREEANQRVQFTTFYEELLQKTNAGGDLEHLVPELFEVAFPVDEIRTISIFDIGAYLEFQRKASKTPGEVKTPKD